jgi:two-component system, LytTR family, response regulator
MKIFIHTLTGARIIDTADIIYLKADGNNTVFHMNYEAKTDKKNNFESIKSLKDNSLLLPDIEFYRCHRSFIINLRFFFEYDTASDKIILEDGTKIKISRERKAEAKEKLVRFLEFYNN